MRKRLFRAPSPAMVVASLALFVALGRTSYAAGNAILSSPSKAQIIKIVNGVAPSLKVGGLATLKSGQSESGMFSGGGGDLTGDWIGVSIDYPRPLAAPIADNHIIDVSGSSATYCPGKGHAAPGYLCFYNEIESSVDPGNDFYSTDGEVLGKRGIVAYWQVHADSPHPYIGGSWTVTAP